MEVSQYRHLAAIQDRHWFYQFRRNLIRKNLEKLLAEKKRPLRLLDFGAGMGANAEVLSKFGETDLVEFEPIAVDFLKSRLPEARIYRTLQEIPAAAQIHYDVILISYVLYHRNITDPSAVLKQLRALTAPDAVLLHMEPAHPILTRRLDVLVGGARRFTRRQLKAIYRESGWQPRRFQFLLPTLFPVAFVLAQLERLRPAKGAVKPGAAEQVSFGALNSLMKLWLATVDRLVSRWAFFGVGLLSIASPGKIEEK